MNRTLVLALAAAVALPLAAQSKNSPNIDPPAPRLVDVVEVRVINVDVVVTDKKGNPVPGLKKDDFEIRENGQVKPISNFYEVSGGDVKNVVEGDAPAEAPQAERKGEVPDSLKRRIIFYIDNLSLAPFNRNRVFQQMKDFIGEIMRPGDEAMIATYNRSMKIRVPFTRDQAQLISAIDTISKESGLGVANLSERRSAEDRIREANSYTEAMSIARQYASSVEHDLRQSVSSINGLLATVAGVEGKKILVLTSEGFPIQPGRELFYMIDELQREKGWQTGSTMLETMSYDGTRLIQDVGRTANANGITLHTIHAAGLTGGVEMSAEHQRPISNTVAQAASTNTTESMILMAQLTGGTYSVQNNNFGAAFDRIERDLQSYYSLGYRAGTERVDRQRYLNVKLKDNKNGYTVRARQTFVEKSIYAEMSDRVIANLLHRLKENDLHIISRVGQPIPVGDGLFKVPVDIQIPIQSLEFLPQGDNEHAGGFDVYVVVADEQNDLSEVARKSHQIRIPEAEMKAAAGKIYTYTLDLLTAPGLNKISIGVVDQISNTTGFTRDQIIARDMR